MKRNFLAICWMLFSLAGNAFAISDGPPPIDSVRDPKTGEVYVVSDFSMQTEKNSGWSGNSQSTGLGLSPILEYILKHYDFDETERDLRDDEACPDGWTKIANEDTIRNNGEILRVKKHAYCKYSISLSPPLRFRLDTGENRIRHFSTAERDAVLKLYSIYDYDFYNTGLVFNFPYIDKSGKSHVVYFVRHYDSDYDGFVPSIIYSLDSGKCDIGWKFDKVFNRCFYYFPEPTLLMPPPIQKHTPPLKAKPTLPTKW